MATKPNFKEELDAAVAAVEKAGSKAGAARLLGIPRSTLRNRLDAVDRFDIPDGFKVKGTSTLYGPDGDEKLIWVKTSADQERQEELFRETLAALASEITPAAKIAAPDQADENLLVGYLIGDAHLGAYAWGAECSGGNFDLSIAERDIWAAVDRLVASTPDAAEAIIVNIGDWFHTDTSKPFTPASGNLLDVGDSRWPKVVNVGVQLLRRICVRALEKHKKVRLRNAKGNHDPHSAIILDVAMKAYFENEPRLIVEDSPRDLFHLRFGSNLIGITHGHNVKPENLPGLLAVDARKEWGACEFRFIWAGHFHAKRVLDIMGTVVTIWPTLAANDKWHSDKGYRSQKEMTAVVLHRDYGKIEEHTAGLKMVRANG
jgi:regulatory Fis family protein